MTPPEPEMRLPYVRREQGRLRLRKRGLPSRWVPRDVEPGSAAFLDLYRDWLHGSPKPAARRIPPGSYAALLAAYRASAAWSRLAPDTRAMRLRYLGVIAGQAPNEPAAALTPQDVRRLRDNRAATPEAANNLVKCISALYRWGCEAGLVDANPAAGVARLPPLRRGGHLAWTPDDVRRFEDRWPLGTRERLVMTLILWTGARRGDVVRLGPHMVTNGWIAWDQEKGKGRVELPLMPPLRAAIDATPRPPVLALRRDLPWLLTVDGKPFKKESFGAWFAAAAEAAGVHARAHGLRKAAGALLAEAGCTPHEIAAVLGHSGTRIGEIYTRTASRRALAAQAMQRMSR